MQFHNFTIFDISTIRKEYFSSLKSIHMLNKNYTENDTVSVIYTNFYTRVYTTVSFSMSFFNVSLYVIFRKLLTCRSQVLNIIMIRRPHVKLYHLKPQTLKHVEILKVSDKPTHDTSLESS